MTEKRLEELRAAWLRSDIRHDEIAELFSEVDSLRRENQSLADGLNDWRDYKSLETKLIGKGPPSPDNDGWWLVTDYEVHAAREYRVLVVGGRIASLSSLNDSNSGTVGVLFEDAQGGWQRAGWRTERLKTT